MKEEVVKVTWIDAQRLELGIIQKHEFAEVEPLDCSIVGFKVYEDKNKIVIAQEKWAEPCGGIKYVHVIPKRSIIKISKLKSVKDD